MADRPLIHQPARRFHRRLATPLAGILLLAVGWYLWQHPPALAPEGAAPATPAATPAQVYFGPRHSVAVLPFADRSADADQAALAHGFAAELQGLLEALPGLQVTARSSSFFFRDATVPMRVVAERVQAAYLLAGDWREQDGAVTVTATLYDAYRDRELWRADYAGELRSVPQIQYAIVRDARAELPGRAAQPPVPAAGPDPRAWVLLQQGRYAADPLGPGDLAAAGAALRAALDIQPDYDAARLELAALWLHPAWPRDADPAAVGRARAAAQEVLERPAVAPHTTDSDRAQAWGLLSHLLHHYDWQWLAADEAAQQGLHIRPGDAGLLALASLARFTLGDLEAAQTLLQASLERDPLNLGSRLRLGLVQEFAGQYDAALASYRRLLNLRPDYPAAHAFRARVKVLQGKAESALKESAQESEPFWRRYAEALALTAAERQDDVHARLRAMIEEDGSVAAFQLAELFAFAGEADEAFTWLARAQDQRDPGLSALLANPLLVNLHADPRWAVLLESLGLPPAGPPELPLDWRE